MFRRGIGFGTGRQRCRKLPELTLEVVLERLSRSFLLLRLLRQTLLRDRRRRSGIELRLSQFVHRELNLSVSV